MLSSLLDDIDKGAGLHTVDVMVIDDYSDQNYDSISDRVHYYWRTKRNYGKEGYWKIINSGMKNIKKMNPYDFYIKTDDDMRLVGGFFDLIEDLIKNINDPNWATLDILSAKKQRGKTLLGHPADIFETQYKYYRTQWVDMNFAFNPNMFPQRIGPVTAGKASSGVGLWLTRYFNKNSINLYQAALSLVIHGKHESQMNVEERKRNPLVTKGKK